ncbi:hypothetical protein [Methylobacterium brachythecii]|nr:hypothetical protein [Methylobacterium brachythecii]MBB3904776.1 hypothetical protein [Methylobacterium brachythecii]
MDKPQTRTFKAFVRPCSINTGRFRWIVIAEGGGHSEHAINSFITEAAAQMAGDARARALTGMGYAR